MEFEPRTDAPVGIHLRYHPFGHHHRTSV